MAITRVKKECVTCGKSIYPKLSDVKRGWGLYCCRSCRSIGIKKTRRYGKKYQIHKESGIFNSWEDDLYDDGFRGI